MSAPGRGGRREAGQGPRLRQRAPATAGHHPVLDDFRISALGMKAVNGVRYREQQITVGQRSHKGDSLYEIRQLLRRRADRLTANALNRLTVGLATGDPDGRMRSSTDLDMS